MCCPNNKEEASTTTAAAAAANDLDAASVTPPPPPPAPTQQLLDWYGAPRFATIPNLHVPRNFRQAVRHGTIPPHPTNAVCPGFLQCNLVVLPAGPVAFDFLLFCQRNPKACPLVEVCQGGGEGSSSSSYVPVGVAPDADLRTDCPK